VKIQENNYNSISMMFWLHRAALPLY